MSLSYLRKTENTLDDALDRSKNTAIQPGPINTWQADSGQSVNQADSPVESSGWNPAEVWPQRIKRDTSS